MGEGWPPAAGDRLVALMRQDMAAFGVRPAADQGLLRGTTGAPPVDFFA